MSDIAKAYVKAERIMLKNHPDVNELWVQQRIQDDPKILGLGDLIVKDVQRRQKHGRLDLLLSDPEEHRRYEVELQLGSTDEEHIIRTVEYWDIECKPYPQYEHFAVIVAEDVTSRFLNVISLFNGAIPLIALQMQCLSVDGRSTLIFTKVLDPLKLGVVDEDEDAASAPADRGYWESKSTKESLGITDALFDLVKTLDPELTLKYNKFYIGLAKHGQLKIFVIFRPQKRAVTLEPRLPQSEDVDSLIESAGLETSDYDTRWGRYRIRVAPGDVQKQRETLDRLIRLAFDSQ